MILTTALASSLWLASTTPREAPISAFQSPLTQQQGDKLAGDLMLNAFGTSADLLSTDWAISKGCHEANPLIPRPEGRIGAKVGLMALRGGLAYLLRSRNRHGWADALRYGGLTVDGLLTFNNIKCGLK